MRHNAKPENVRCKPMKKTIYTILTLLSVVACRQKNTTEQSSFNKLSVYYKDTTFADLFIYPDTAYIDSLFFFKGKQIDSITFNLLAENVTRGLPWTEGFYGIYSFKLNSQFVGLLTRTPGEYSTTALSLWIYDIAKDSIVNNIQLADIFGDAGDAQTTNSYIFFDKESTLNALTLIHYTHDHSLDDVEFPDSKVDESYSYYLTKINADKIDTLSKDSTALIKQYAKQLKRMAIY
jgi:hypothetical protein